MRYSANIKKSTTLTTRAIRVVRVGGVSLRSRLNVGVGGSGRMGGGITTVAIRVGCHLGIIHETRRALILSRFSLSLALATFTWSACVTVKHAISHSRLPLCRHALSTWTEVYPSCMDR